MIAYERAALLLQCAFMTGNQLKILALVTMTVDHVGVVLLPQYPILRIIGRLTYPIFAYMIAEGCFYTHDRRRYLGGIFALGLACQCAFFLALGSLEQSILTTFTFAIITIYALQLAERRRDLAGYAAVAGALALDAFVSIALPRMLAGTDYAIDYGFFGILLPAFCYAPRIFFRKAVDRRRLLLMLACAAVGLVLLCVQMSAWMGGIQWFSLLSIIPLACYDGTRGTWHLKYLFYIYYPAHLVAIWGIAQMLQQLPFM